MELEQRVKLLEQEVEILKNQIQATLLDIQAQLLTNAYPSLRMEEDTARPAPNRAFGSPNAGRAIPDEVDEAPPHDRPEVRKVSATNGRAPADDDAIPPAVSTRPVKSARVVRSQPPELDDDEPAQAREQSIVRKISATNDREQANDDTIISARPVKSTRIARSQPTESDEAGDADEPDQAYGQSMVRKISAANDREQADDDTIISARPVKSARIARSQPPEPDEADDANDHPSRSNGSANGRSAQAQAQSTGSHRPGVKQIPFDAEHTNMEAWISNRVEQIGVTRTLELIQVYEQKGRITPATREVLLQFLAVYAPADDPLNQPAAESADSQRTILKLIAGIQNAGAGIGRRRKKNG